MTFNLDKLWIRSTELRLSHYEYTEGDDSVMNTGSRFRFYIENTLAKFPFDEQEKMNFVWNDGDTYINAS